MYVPLYRTKIRSLSPLTLADLLTPCFNSTFDVCKIPFASQNSKKGSSLLQINHKKIICNILYGFLETIIGKYHNETDRNRNLIPVCALLNTIENQFKKRRER